MRINEELSVVTKQILENFDFGESDCLNGFDWVCLGPFVQDIEDWTDPNTGEFFKATMDYFSWLSGRRILDGTYFSVRFRLDHTVVDGFFDAEKKVDYLRTHLANARMQLASYANCSCVVGVHCERHSRQ